MLAGKEGDEMAVRRRSLAQRQAAAIMRDPSSFRDPGKPAARKPVPAGLSAVAKEPELPVIKLPDWIDQAPTE